MLNLGSQIDPSTRARRSDSVSSHIAAARHAATPRTHAQRAKIVETIKAARDGMTARQVSLATGMDYYVVQRRISECEGIIKTDEMRGGVMVWRAVGL